jgi:hypothetical protein
MPALDQQAELPEAFTADFTVLRALLTKGRSYEQSVKTLEPYSEIKAPSEGARAGMQRISVECVHHTSLAPRIRHAGIMADACARVNQGNGSET